MRAIPQAFVESKYLCLETGPAVLAENHRLFYWAMAYGTSRFYPVPLCSPNTATRKKHPIGEVFPWD